MLEISGNGWFNEIPHELIWDLNGFKTTKKIREIEKDKNLIPVPIIVVTGNHEKLDI